MEANKTEERQAEGRQARESREAWGGKRSRRETSKAADPGRRQLRKSERR